MVHEILRSVDQLLNLLLIYADVHFVVAILAQEKRPLQEPTQLGVDLARFDVFFIELADKPLVALGDDAQMMESGLGSVEHGVISSIRSGAQVSVLQYQAGAFQKPIG
jgi:hypothetical protein